MGKRKRKPRPTVKLKHGAAVTTMRVALNHQWLVYVIQASKSLEYEKGRSRIAYIGTTMKGLSRIAQSVAARAPTVLELHGVKKLTVRIVTCTDRPLTKANGKKGKSWFLLERAMLLAFVDLLGEKPKCNAESKVPRRHDVWHLFRRQQVDAIIRRLGKKPRSRSK